MSDITAIRTKKEILNTVKLRKDMKQTDRNDEECNVQCRRLELERQPVVLLDFFDPALQSRVGESGI
jgi:hypothetical protein